jgi:hypothetical protein
MESFGHNTIKNYAIYMGYLVLPWQSNLGGYEGLKIGFKWAERHESYGKNLYKTATWPCHSSIS